MAIKFEKLQVGQTLYDRHKQRMGNTPLRTIGEWPVKILALNAEKKTATVSWNTNPPETWNEYELKGLSDWSMHRNPDVVVVRGLWDCVVSVRKMTKAEKAARDARVSSKACNDPNPDGTSKCRGGDGPCSLKCMKAEEKTP